jgi:hypothetical protein
MSGTAAETLLHPDCEPWVARSDIGQARALASLICASEAAIDTYLAFGLAEAKALIDANSHVVLALANTLVERRTLDGDEIDAIIERAVAEKDLADERARRAGWKRVEAKAPQNLLYDRQFQRCTPGTVPSAPPNHRMFGGICPWCGRNPDPKITSDVCSVKRPLSSLGTEQFHR